MARATPVTGVTHRALRAVTEAYEAITGRLMAGEDAELVWFDDPRFDTIPAQA